MSGGGAKAVVENSDSDDEGSVLNAYASVVSEASTVQGGEAEEVDETSQLQAEYA
jgi:hypothetical protein